jgi:hypothetical protein
MRIVEMNQVADEANREIAPGLFHVSGPALDLISPSAIVAVTKARDEAWRFPFWLAYHRWFGVDHFIVVDNRSVDETKELLSNEADVTLLHAPGSFGGELGHIHWIGSILGRAPRERWNLLLDLDELYVTFPWRQRGLREAVRQFEAEDVDVGPALMVDCYPPRFPMEEESISIVPWERAPLFDAGPYAYWSRRQRRPHLFYRGARERIFWSDRWWQRFLPKTIRRKFGITKPPHILKDPLFRQAATRGGLPHEGTHPIARRARQLSYILHYKFDIDFSRKLSLALKERQYFVESIEYDTYRTLPEGEVVLESRRSRRFTGLKSLIEARLCLGPPLFPEARKAIAEAPDVKQVRDEIMAFMSPRKPKAAGK